MENDQTNLLKRIEAIESRNKRVELDKAWETSTERKIIIALATYLFIMLVFFIIGVDKPHVNAIIPTFGFLLSTLSPTFFKNLWLKSRSGK